MSIFSNKLIAWQKVHGRHHLPWQNTKDPYRIWLSEIMLQQTQVAKVKEYYERFLQYFPTIQALAVAPIDDVLTLWSGLGYYARARHLHRTAQIITTQYAGVFPEDIEVIQSFPGIGRSTASAIGAFAFGQCVPILDGNVKRVLTRYGGVFGYPGDKKIEQQLWRYAESLLPEQEIEAYIQGQMDLGAQICTPHNPSCLLCPLQKECIACQNNLVEKLPTPKQRAPLNERTEKFYLIVVEKEQADSKILMYRRPLNGLWGGLYSLPDATHFEQLPFKATPPQSYLQLKHLFTHFKLNLMVYRTMVAQEYCIPEFNWYTKAQIQTLALPVPIKKIIDAYFNVASNPE